MASAMPTHGLDGPFRVAKRITGWNIVAAALFIVLGMFAIIEPAVAGLGITLLVGWLLILGGVIHLVGAFKGARARQIIFQLLIGLAYVIGGLYFLAHPLLAIGALTLLLAAVILAEGVLEIISYFRMEGEEASGWILFNGIITLLGRNDLVPLAIEFGLGHRHTGGSESFDDRYNAADVRASGAKGHQTGGRVSARLRIKLQLPWIID